MEKIIELKDFVIRFIKLNKNLVLRILAVLIVITSIIVITSALKKEEYGNSAGNVYNYGISATSGKWIYYMAIDDNEPSGIYRVKTNGDKTEKVTEGSYTYINVLDNYIYCLEYDEDGEEFNLVKMKKNGEKKETLAKNVDKSPITVVDDDIYYFKDSNFYRIEKDGSDKQKISSKDITYYQIYNDTIYYIYENEGNSNIATMELDGEDSKRLARLTDSEFIALQVRNNKIYYITAKGNEENNTTEYTLYKMNKKGEKQERISKLPEGIENINMQEDAIYYAIEGDGYEIYKVNYKAGNKEPITKVSDLYFMNVSEDWLFFVTEDEDDSIIIERISTDGEEKQQL